MEGLIKKYQQKVRKVKEEMENWEVLQSRLISQFGNASAIIDRLPVIQNLNNYGALKCVKGIENAVLRKQMESLQLILFSIKQTLEEFWAIVLFMEKSHRDAREQVKGGSSQLSSKQLKQKIGLKPSLLDCLDGLDVLHEMHRSEYLLKVSLVSGLSALVLKPSPSDLRALQQLLVDQPNIPKEEVQHHLDIIFAEEIC